jgi:hypothetical protein
MTKTVHRYATLNGKLYRSSKDTPLEVSEDKGQTWRTVPRYPSDINVDIPNGYDCWKTPSAVYLLPKAWG